MKIYTKTGDSGLTSLFSGGRVQKNATRIDAYGTVDELNATIGVVRAHEPSLQSDNMLCIIQNDLFVLGSDLATPMDAKAQIKRVTAEMSTQLESWIDELEATLEPLRYFVLPGGCKTASFLHISRTVCRRAERCVVTARQTEQISDDVIIYLNRLSDLLFVMSRFENHVTQTSEVRWITD
jgi:cob(I)alamin adenosyltransferase